MNASDQIQARRDERARWETELTAAREGYDEALLRPHNPGRILEYLHEMRAYHERILAAKFKLDWLRWCDEMDEGRWRESDGSV